MPVSGPRSPRLRFSSAGKGTWNLYSTNTKEQTCAHRFMRLLASVIDKSHLSGFLAHDLIWCLGTFSLLLYLTPPHTTELKNNNHTCSQISGKWPRLSLSDTPAPHLEPKLVKESSRPERSPVIILWLSGPSGSTGSILPREVLGWGFRIILDIDRSKPSSLAFLPFLWATQNPFDSSV